MTTAGSRSRSKSSAAAPPPAAPCDELTLDTPVCVAGVPEGCDFAFHMPNAQSPEQAQSIVAREAMRWTYVLRSRRRWVDESATREQNELAARAALAQVGLGEDKLERLAAGDRIVVRIPWTGIEALHWESRILPWEYVLAAATRHYRLKDSRNGRPRPLTVMRELRLLTAAMPPPPRPETLFAEGVRALIVECLPPELREHWDLEGEYARLRKALPDAQWRVLSWPTPEELTEAVRDLRPQFMHFAGLDSHQGLRELRRYIGAEARIDLGPAYPTPAADALPSGETGLPPGVRRIEDVVADRRLTVDGLLLRGAPHTAGPVPAPGSVATSASEAGVAASAVRSYPRLVPAQELAKVLAESGHCTYFVSFNLWNSAARIAPLVVAERGALAAMGFQDAFDDGLAEYVYALMYAEIRRSNGNVPLAFETMWTLVRELPESVNATGITLWAGAPVLARHSPAGAGTVALRGVPLAVKGAAADTRVEVKVKPFLELNYAVLHNARPLFEHFVLECDAPEANIEVDVDVSVHMGMETARYQRRVCVNKRRITLTNDIHVPLTAALIRGTQEAITSSLVVRVVQGERTLYHDSHRLRLLPVDQWRDNIRDAPWLPSFVQPRDPAVPRAVELAQRYVRVLRDDPNSGFEGYQLANAADEASLRGVDRQVESIWAALLHDWQLSYVNPPPSYSAALDSQRLRLPSTVWNHRSGTCIDLALLFAACLEYVDIHPVVFLLKGHALPGWWRHPDFRDEYLEMPQARSSEVVQMSATENPMANAQAVAWHTGGASWGEIRRWIRQRKLVPIETVRLTERGSFVDAIESGVAALAERRDFDSMLEIVTARYQGVTPLPVREN